MEKEEIEEELILLYARAMTIVQQKQQVVGEKNDYYVTLKQLESQIKRMFDEIRVSKTLKGSGKIN
jgi:hypothetical protein